MKTVLVGAALAALMAAPLAAHAAQGLNGDYYVPTSDLGFGDSPGGPGNLANAISQISGETPTATFTANTVCFPSCGGTLNDGGSTIADFLGGNASGLSANTVTDLSNHVVVLTGFLNIASTGSYNLALGSDDGSELIVDNTVLLNDDDDHGFGGPSGNFTLTAGSHAIEIVQFEDGGGTGLTVDINGQGLGGSFLSTTGGVPEPAAWTLMLLGVASLGGALRSRRRAIAA